GNPRRNGIHQHARRIGGLPARHINADRIERPHQLPQPSALGIAYFPVLISLGLGIARDAGRRLFQSRPCLRRQGCECCLHLCGRNLERRRTGWRMLIQLARIFQQGAVAAHLDVLDDRGHTRLDLRLGGCILADQLGEYCLEIIRRRIQAPDHAALRTLSSNNCSNCVICSCCIFCAATLTTTRALISRLVYSGCSPLARSVLPISTRSTITSARRTRGVNSFEPRKRIISIWRPLLANQSHAVATYFVVTPSGRLAAVSSAPGRAAVI